VLARDTASFWRTRIAVAVAVITAADGKEAVVKELLRDGADANAVRADGITALMAASMGGHFSIIQLLVDKGERYIRLLTSLIRTVLTLVAASSTCSLRVKGVAMLHKQATSTMIAVHQQYLCYSLYATNA
jgi:Ankyrin repeats (3 copies)